MAGERASATSRTTTRASSSRSQRREHRGFNWDFLTAKPLARPVPEVVGLIVGALFVPTAIRAAPASAAPMARGTRGTGERAQPRARARPSVASTTEKPPVHGTGNGTVNLAGLA